MTPYSFKVCSWKYRFNSNNEMGSSLVFMVLNIIKAALVIF